MIKSNQKDLTKAVSDQLEKLDGTLENLINYRKTTVEVQLRLLESCRTHEEINCFKTEGLFDSRGLLIH